MALDAVDTGGRSSDEIDALIRRTPGPGSVLPPSALDYFRLDRTSGLATFDAGFSVVITLDGTATLSTDRSEQRLEPGSTTLIPHAAGRFEVTGECLIARPLSPDERCPGVHDASRAPNRRTGSPPAGRPGSCPLPPVGQARLRA
ncbi:hypothetical protein [Agromyces marinus]|uniref:hypothetical protein n=1 Tax=Agromyces marinus TaxID=1389020 RepID=UPI003D9AD8D6